MAETEPTDVDLRVTALYDHCNRIARNSEQRFKKTFTQGELLELCGSGPLEIIADAPQLLALVQEMSNRMLFISLKQKAGLCWALRPRDAATRIRTLRREELMVYSAIEAAHDSAIWLKHIKAKTNIQDQNALDKIIKRLSQLHLIKQVTNHKVPLQKMYILFHLAPSDEVTGGSFYDEGDLDESLVEELQNLIVFHVRMMSWAAEEKRKRVKKEASPVLTRDNDEPAAASADQGERRGRGKRKRDTTIIDIEDSAPPPAPPPPKKQQQRSHKHAHDPETTTQVAFPAGHEYPTSESIHYFIVSGNYLKGVKSASLTVEEIQGVVNVLVWDGKLERVNGGFRTVRGIDYRPPDPDQGEGVKGEKERRWANGLTEAPCGQCPVVDICGNGGPVNATSCVYFNDWLCLKAA